MLKYTIQAVKLCTALLSGEYDVLRVKKLQLKLKCLQLIKMDREQPNKILNRRSMWPFAGIGNSMMLYFIYGV